MVPAVAREMPRGSIIAWWLLASIVAHALLMRYLPGWRVLQEIATLPLQVELREPPPPPPAVTPPKAVPEPARVVEPPKQKSQTPPQPETVQRPRRDPRPEPPQPVAQVQPQPQPELPLLLAAPKAPPTPQSPVVVPPSQTPAPPAAPTRSEAPRAAPAPPPMIPPRSDAAYLNNPPPPYPLAAKRNGEQGTVMVLVQVTVEGLAASVKLEKSSGYPGLDDAALRAVRSWRFVPARQGDKPVAAPFVVPVVFSLKPQ